VAARVDLFAPRGLRMRSTDLDPGWFGPKYLRGFASSSPERRERIAEARVGTTTPGMAERLRSRRASADVRIIEKRGAAVVWDQAGSWVEASGRHGPYAAVYEATGYAVANVGWLADLGLAAVGGLPVLDHGCKPPRVCTCSDRWRSSSWVPPAATCGAPSALASGSWT
jgi:hypothetical protein